MARQQLIDANLQSHALQTSSQLKKTSRRPAWDNSFALPQKYEKPPRLFFNKPTEDELLLKRSRIPTSQWTVTHEIYTQPFLSRKSKQSNSYKTSLSKKSSPTNVPIETEQHVTFDLKAPKKRRRGSARLTYEDSPYAVRKNSGTVKSKKVVEYPVRHECRVLFENKNSKSTSRQKIRRGTNYYRKYEDVSLTANQSSSTYQVQSGLDITKVSNTGERNHQQRTNPRNYADDGSFETQVPSSQDQRRLYKARDSVVVMQRSKLNHGETNTTTIDGNSIEYGKRSSTRNVTTTQGSKTSRKGRGGKCPGPQVVPKHVHNANKAGGEEPAMYAHFVDGRDRNMVRFSNLCHCDASGVEKNAPLNPSSVHRLQKRLAEIGKELGDIVGI